LGEELYRVLDAAGGRLKVNLMLSLLDGPLRPSEVSKRLNAPTSNAYRAFNELRDAGLAESFEEGGVVRWRLTERGRRFVELNLALLRGEAARVPERPRRLQRLPANVPSIAAALIFLYAVASGIASGHYGYAIGGAVVALVARAILKRIFRRLLRPP